MYAELLDLALGQDGAEGESTKGHALADLVERRAKAHSGRAGDNAEGVSGALADQLAYDIALIRFSRRVGIESHPRDFSRPSQERERLEQALSALGIALPEQA